MKRIQILIITCIAIGAFSTQYGWAQEKIEEDFTVPLSMPNAPAEVKIHSHNGSVIVKGTSQSGEVAVKVVTYQGRNDKPAKVDGLTRIPNTSSSYKITEDNNEVHISGDHHSRADFEVMVPRNVTLSVNTHHNGDVVVSDVQGEMEIDTHHGGIHMENVAGSVVADTHHGEIKVTFTAIDGNQPMAFSAYHGDVDISFPSSLNADVKMKSERGDIYTDFAIDPRREGPRQVKESSGTVIVSGGWTYATIGNGGPEYMFNTHHGDVIIRKK